LGAAARTVGPIGVETCHWLEDDPCFLSPAKTDEIMVGAAGYLQPEKPEFAEYPNRYHRNPFVRECFAAKPVSIDQAQYQSEKSSLTPHRKRP
jgi:hypothetical protein